MEEMASWRLNSRRVMWRYEDDRHIDNWTDIRLAAHIRTHLEDCVSQHSSRNVIIIIGIITMHKEVGDVSRAGSFDNLESSACARENYRRNRPKHTVQCCIAPDTSISTQYETYLGDSAV